MEPTEYIRFGSKPEVDLPPIQEVAVHRYGFSWKHHHVNFYEKKPSMDLQILLQAVYLQGKADARDQIRKALDQ